MSGRKKSNEQGRQLVPAKTVAERINSLVREFNEELAHSVIMAIEIGELLVAEKKLCKHGEWENWVRDNLEISSVTAWRFMRCYTNRGALNLSSTKDLGAVTIEKFAAVAEHKEPKPKAERPIVVAEIVREPKAERPIVVAVPVQESKGEPRTFEGNLHSGLLTLKVMVMHLMGIENTANLEMAFVKTTISDELRKLRDFADQLATELDSRPASIDLATEVTSGIDDVYRAKAMAAFENADRPCRIKKTK